MSAVTRGRRLANIRRDRQADRCRATGSDPNRPGGPGTHLPPSPSSGASLRTAVSFNLPLTPATIQHEIAAGNARVAGTAVVDGAQTVELAISGFDGPGSSGDIWVDTSSYLPVCTVVSEPVRIFGQSASTGTQTVQDDYQFLPATPANLEQLHPVIPPGFTENPTLDDPVTSEGS